MELKGFRQVDEELFEEILQYKAEKLHMPYLIIKGNTIMIFYYTQSLLIHNDEDTIIWFKVSNYVNDREILAVFSFKIKELKAYHKKTRRNKSTPELANELKVELEKLFDEAYKTQDDSAVHGFIDQNWDIFSWCNEYLGISPYSMETMDDIIFFMESLIKRIREREP